MAVDFYAVVLWEREKEVYFLHHSGGASFLRSGKGKVNQRTRNGHIQFTRLPRIPAYTLGEGGSSEPPFRHCCEQRGRAMRACPLHVLGATAGTRGGWSGNGRQCADRISFSTARDTNEREEREREKRRKSQFRDLNSLSCETALGSTVSSLSTLAQFSRLFHPLTHSPSLIHTLVIHPSPFPFCDRSCTRIHATLLHLVAHALTCFLSFPSFPSSFSPRRMSSVCLFALLFLPRSLTQRCKHARQQ